MQENGPGRFWKVEEADIRADQRVTEALDAGLADFAAPASALEAIAGLSVKGFGPAWEIPFQIRTTRNGPISQPLQSLKNLQCAMPTRAAHFAEAAFDCHVLCSRQKYVMSAGARVLTLEKPLLSRRGSAREKHTRLFKWALVSAGTKSAPKPQDSSTSQSGHQRSARQMLQSVPEFIPITLYATPAEAAQV